MDTDNGMGMPRYTSEDIEVGGGPVSEGNTLLTLRDSADRDENHLPGPSRSDPRGPTATSTSLRRGPALLPRSAASQWMATADALVVYLIDLGTPSRHARSIAQAPVEPGLRDYAIRSHNGSESVRPLHELPGVR